MIFWELFIGFLKVGAFTFGGGYAAIPIIRELVLSNGWLSEETLAHMIAVSESTPGPIMVNMATYVGSSQAGLSGALIATTAVVLPSFFIILLVMVVLKTVIKNRYVQAVLRGLKPCVIGIILATGGFMVFRNCFRTGQLNAADTIITVLLALILFGAKGILKKKISPIAFILLSACFGIIAYGF